MQKFNIIKTLVVFLLFLATVNSLLFTKFSTANVFDLDTNKAYATASTISSSQANPVAVIPKSTTWQWQLTGAVDQSVDAKLFNIDLFDNSQTLITSLKTKGKTVICYFSAGSYENWRIDANSFPVSVLGSQLDGWPGEKWLDIKQISLLSPIITARMDLAKSKGCDGLEPDNVDGYRNNSGFDLTAAEQITYNKFLATEAHKRGLLIGLKNDIDQITALEPFFFAVNEQCFEYSECDTYQPFLQAGKAVFNVEYNLNVGQFCSQANTLGIMAMKKKIDLDASRTVCWTTTTPPQSSPSNTTSSTSSSVVNSSPQSSPTNSSVGSSTLAIKVNLQGFYDSSTGLMRNDLKVKNLIPGNQPYSTLGYTGAEFSSNMPADVVDWVLVELRNPVGNVINQKAALLKTNGLIIEADGSNPKGINFPVGTN